MIAKKVTRDDLQWLLAQRNRDELNVFFNQAGYLSIEEQEKWYQQVLDKKFHSFIIWSGDNRVGYVALKDIDYIVRRAEFGIFVVPEERSRGYGAFALKYIVEYGFNVLNLNKIYSTVFEFNGAVRMYKNFGFKVDGKLRDDCFKKGKYWDSYYISLLSREYKT